MRSARGRHAERQRPQQVRHHPRHRPAFADEEPHLGQAQRLQRSQPAVQRLVAVERGAGAEVAAIDQCDPQPALRRVPRGQGRRRCRRRRRADRRWNPPAGAGRAASVRHCTIAGCDHRAGPPLLERAHPRPRDDHAPGGQPRVLRRPRRLPLRQAALPARAGRLRRLSPAGGCSKSAAASAPTWRALPGAVRRSPASTCHRRPSIWRGRTSRCSASTAICASATARRCRSPTVRSTSSTATACCSTRSTPGGSSPRRTAC